MEEYCVVVDRSKCEWLYEGKLSIKENGACLVLRKDGDKSHVTIAAFPPDEWLRAYVSDTQGRSLYGRSIG